MQEQPEEVKLSYYNKFDDESSLAYRKNILQGWVVISFM